jgi:hypothetical protein
VETNRWTTIWPLGRVANPGVFLHARLLFSHPSLPRGLFVCCAAPAVLQRLTDRIAADALPWTLTWASLGALRTDVTPAVVSMRDQIIDERPAGDTGSRARLFARVAGYEDDDGEID